jgi:HSP20 family protein
MAPVPQFPFISHGETRELADDIRALFDELAASLKHEQRAYSGECHPSLDVLETDAAVEIVVDVSGVPRDALRIVFRGGVVIIAGEKAPVLAAPHDTFHLVEREFGRFARAVRVTGAFDVGRARAELRDGELVVTLPKMDERRGHSHRIPITSDEPRPA